MKHIVSTFGLVVFLVTVIKAAEEEYFLQAAGDAYVDAEAPLINTGDDEIITVFADWEDQMVGPSKVLIRFDKMDTVHGVDIATLTLHPVGSDNDTGEVEVYRVGEEWLEMEVTWESRPLENRDYSVSSTPPQQGLIEIDVTQIVGSWVYDEFPNYGFYIDVPDRGRWVDVDFASREHPDEGLQPELYIYYGGCNEIEEDHLSPVELNITPVTTSTVRIDFSIPSPYTVSLSVYDASGSLVSTLVEGPVESGNHNLTWRPECCGVYFARLEAQGVVQTEKFILVR